MSAVPAEELDERVRELVASRLEALESAMIERMRKKIEEEMFEKIKGETAVKIEASSQPIKPVVTEENAARFRVIQSIRGDSAKRPPVYNGLERGDVLDSWISTMDAHIRCVRLIEHDPSFLNEYEIALSFLELHPRRVAERLFAERKGDVPWRVLRAELIDKFGDQKSVFALLRELKSIKQSARSASDYALEFERKLDGLILLNWNDSLTVVTTFLEGFDDNVGRKLLDALFSQSKDPMADLMLMPPNEAVRSLTQLARRREELASLMPSKPVLARLAVVEAAPAARPVARQSFAGRESDEAKLVRLDSLVKGIVKRHGIALALVKQRVLKNLCGVCM
jgi:hypothetical protein